MTTTVSYLMNCPLFQITPDPSGRREIRNLLVYCDFHESGCEENLKWKDLAVR